MDRPRSAARRETYASAQINERRARILSEALALIVETGSTGSTVQELSRRAGVAPPTLYCAFGDKEGVTYAPWVIKAMDVALAEILRVPNYAPAMVEVYFSPSADSRIVGALRNISNGLPALFEDGLRARG